MEKKRGGGGKQQNHLGKEGRGTGRRQNQNVIEIFTAELLHKYQEIRNINTGGSRRGETAEKKKQRGKEEHPEEGKKVGKEREKNKREGDRKKRERTSGGKKLDCGVSSFCSGVAKGNLL